MKRLVNLAVAVVVGWAGTASAQRNLSLDEALSLARQNNRDLRQAKERLDATAAQIELARAPLLPTLAVQGKYTRNFQEASIDLSQFGAAFTGLATATQASGVPNQAPLQAFIDGYKAANANVKPVVISPLDQLDFTASATIPLVVPYAYPGLEAANRTVAAAKANYQVNEQSVLVGAAQAFYAAAGTDELVAARTHAIEVAQKTLDNAKARLDAGVVNKVEVMRAEVVVIRAKQALKETFDIREQAYRALTTLLVLTEPVKVAPPAVESTEIAPPVEQLAKDALELRPEMSANRKQLLASQSQTLSAKLRWAPSLSGFGLFRAFNYSGFTGTNYSWAVGAQLDWLLYDGGVRDAQRHQAQAQEREARLRLDLIQAQLTDELFNARRAVDTKREALSAAQRNLALSKETLDLVRVQYDAGTATQLDLLTAQDTLINSEVGVAQARFDFSLSDIALRRAAGKAL